MPPRRFLQPTQASNSAHSDARFAKPPKFQVGSPHARDESKLKEIATQSPIMRRGNDDSIQDQSSFENDNEDQSVDESGKHEDEEEIMLFDHFIKSDFEPSIPLRPTSPVRKKQKLEDSHNASNAPLFAEPQLSPSTPLRSTAHPFRYLSTPKVESSYQTPSRPVFLTPAPTEESQEPTLSALLSPHRKTQKFLPSGLATTMRTHIIEATSIHGHACSKVTNDMRYRIKSACLLSGLIAMESQTPGKNFLLVNHGTTPTYDQVILIKGIAWNVSLEDQIWYVVLDWKVDR